MFTDLKHPFLSTFPGDDELNPMQRQTPNDMYCRVAPIGFPKAELIAINEDLMKALGAEFPLDQETTSTLKGNPPTTLPTYATAYAGHQFGNWAGQLGDGRAIYLGETRGLAQHPWELQYKGAGATPYSRRGDGRAVLRSTIREYLMSEAMHHLRVPTTRSLSMALTGEDVMRDIMYNGNAAYEKGAVMIRAAESFIRFGHFEFLTANDKPDLLKQLADYTIRRYYPLVTSKGKDKYLDFFAMVQEKTIHMIIEWYRVGFVHGVMNTDNMSIHGLTMDYGPFAMLEDYNLKFTPNTTDLPGRRYAFGQQANIALWNLNALANALYPLINDAEPLQEILHQYETTFWSKFDAMMGRKLGFDTIKEDDQEIIKQWQMLMIKLKLDYTLFFSELKNLHTNLAYNINVDNLSYQKVNKQDQEDFYTFIKVYHQRIHQNQISKKESYNLMKRSNPEFVLRNYLLYEATQEAEHGNYDSFFKLWDALQTPYENKYPEFFKKRPNWAEGVPGCSMLSCSS